MQISMRVRIPIFTAMRVVYNTMYRMVYPFLTFFARGLGVDLSTIAYALTARSIAGTLGPFAAAAADRRGRRFGMLMGAAFFIMGTAVVVFSPTFPALVFSLIFSTLGKYIFDPSLQAFIGDGVPYEHRGRAIAITEFGWSLAFILGVPLVGFLIARAGWMAPFPLLALLGAVIFAGLFWMLPRDEKLATGNQPQNNFSMVLTSIPALTGVAIGLFTSCANEQVNLIFGAWLENSFGLQIAALGLASAIIGLSELSAEGLVAIFVDRIGKPRAITMGLVVNSLAALALPFIGHTEAEALVGLFFFYLSFEFTMVSFIPLMTELLPTTRATLMAFNVAAMSLGRALGALLAPRLYGLGFLAVVLGTFVFNLVALLAVSRLRYIQA
jgi:predicted MFS family arabinose efflux permease